MRVAARRWPLKVSAPFHCALMEPAAARLDLALAAVTFVAASTRPVVANVDGAPNDDPARAKALLVQQVAGAVRWADSVRAMLDAGVDTFIEVGPGQRARGAHQAHPASGASVWNVSDPASLTATVESLRAKGAV